MKKRLPLFCYRTGKCSLGILMAGLFATTAFAHKPTFANNLTLSTGLLTGHQMVDVTITGTVVDRDGEPLPGVTISVQGTTVGTVSDIDGRYSIVVPEGGSLVFSFIGFERQVVEVGGRSVINITLNEDTASLDEVVVIGYGTQERRDISTSIASVSSEDLKDRPSTNFAQSIQGKMAGVRIANNNTAPGGGSNIVIRGVSSINASNSPLIVIDGFPIKDGYNKTENPLNSINPADIESIEVLKDASSSAIYGTQAANGVILVTTKKGKSGKPSISISASSGVQSMLNKVKVLNRDQFLQMMDDSRAAAYIIEDPNFGTNDPEAPL